MYYAIEYNNQTITDGFCRDAVIKSATEYFTEYFDFEAMEEGVTLLIEDEDDNQTTETVTIYTAAQNGAAYPTIWNKTQLGLK